MKVKITPDLQISLMHAECIDLTDIVGPMTAERDELAMKLDKSREQHAATLDRLYEIFNIDEKDGEVLAKLVLLKAQEVADKSKVLAAQVNVLRAELQTCQNVLHSLAHSGEVCWDYPNGAKEVLKQTPAACLAQLKADAVEQFWLDGASTMTTDEAKKYVESIRQGGAA